MLYSLKGFKIRVPVFRKFKIQSDISNLSISLSQYHATIIISSHSDITIFFFVVSHK